MPIYEYACNACHHQFELLVLRPTAAVCPRCKSEDLDRLVSLSRLKSDTTTSLAMRAAKRRDQAQATERMHERVRYEQSHDRHG